MKDELITPENLSQEMLQSLFETAYLDYELDDDGDIVIRDGYPTYVFLSESRERVHLVAFASETRYEFDEKVRVANRINDEVSLIRAAVSKQGRYDFDYTILVKGGLTRKHIVSAIRQFQSVVARAVGEFLPKDDDDGLPDIGQWSDSDMEEEDSDDLEEEDSDHPSDGPHSDAGES